MEWGLHTGFLFNDYVNLIGKHCLVLHFFFPLFWIFWIVRERTRGDSLRRRSTQCFHNPSATTISRFGRKVSHHKSLVPFASNTPPSLLWVTPRLHTYERLYEQMDFFLFCTAHWGQFHMHWVIWSTFIFYFFFIFFVRICNATKIIANGRHTHIHFTIHDLNLIE